MFPDAAVADYKSALTWVKKDGSKSTTYIIQCWQRETVRYISRMMSYAG